VLHSAATATPPPQQQQLPWQQQLQGFIAWSQVFMFVATGWRLRGLLQASPAAAAQHVCFQNEITKPEAFRCTGGVGCA
jgi:hypothetical protein